MLGPCLLAFVLATTVPYSTISAMPPHLSHSQLKLPTLARSYGPGSCAAACTCFPAPISVSTSSLIGTQLDLVLHYFRSPSLGSAADAFRVRCRGVKAGFNVIFGRSRLKFQGLCAACATSTSRRSTIDQHAPARRLKSQYVSSPKCVCGHMHLPTASVVNIDTWKCGAPRAALILITDWRQLDT
jgi:hypothetical protein